MAWPGALRVPEKPGAKNVPEMGKNAFVGRAGIWALENSWWLGTLGGGGGLLLKNTGHLHLQQRLLLTPALTSLGPACCTRKKGVGQKEDGAEVGGNKDSRHQEWTDEILRFNVI